MSDPSHRAPDPADPGSDPFRQMAEAAPLGMFQTDRSGTTVFANESWRQITGVREPLPLRPDVVMGTVHPDDQAEVISLFTAAVDALASFETEVRVPQPDGSIRICRLASAPVLAPDGTFGGHVGTLLDITAHIEATEALRSSEERYRNLMDHAPVGQVVYALDGLLVEINQSGAALLGYRPEEIQGTIATDFLVEEDLPLLTSQLERLVAGEASSIEIQHRLLHRDGHPVWVANNITIERGQDGQPLHFHALTLDISDRKAAEDALRRSEARYRMLIDDSPIGQVISKVDGTLVEVNRAFLDMMNVTAAELLARRPIDLLHPDDARQYQQEVPRLLNGEIDTIDRERRLMRADGTTVWVSGGTTMIREAGETLLHSVMQDITDRKEAEALLRESEERASTVIGSLHEGLIIYSREGLLLANESASRILDIPPEELELSPLSVLSAIAVLDLDGQEVPLEDRSVYVTLIEGRPHHEIMRGFVTRSGRTVWCLVNAIPLFHEGQDEPYAGVLSFNEITDQKESTDALRASEDRFRTLTESIPVAVYQADTEGRVVYVNPQWRAINEVAENPTTYEDALAPVHPDDLDRVAEGLGRVLTDGGTFHDQYRIIAPDGSLKWLNNRGAATLDDEGRVTGIIGSIEEVTALVAAQEQNARLAGIIESSSDLVGITDARTLRLVYLNRSARQVFGLVDRDVSEVSCLDLYTPDASALYRNQILPALLRGQTWSGELTMVTEDGVEIEAWQSIVPTLRADGSLHQISTVGRDVTERRRLEKDLAHQATHDSLTDLPNRVLLLDHLELALAGARRDDRLVALLFLDLDRFKQVNDTQGHDAGDELLAQAARRISHVVRPSDTVARLGGDEFVILCADVEDEDHATAVAHRVARAIDAQPFVIGDTEVAVSASIGIALSAGGEAHPESLLRDADAAMYRAKDLGRARLEIYDESMRRRTAQRLELADELAAGIESGEITVRFQPGVDLETGQVTCVEALARWVHPERGELSPHEFIGVAEETGLIVGLGLRVLSTACEHARRWEKQFGFAAPRVHVNLSARQLTTSNLPVLVQGVLEGSGLTPSRLCLEITESVLMEDASGVIDTLWELKAIGVTLAIDDFGTGYSSLSYLRRFPVDVLKVDRSFVSGLGPDPEDSTIVAAIVNLAATLDLEAIAEGVETADQVDRLRGLGCRLAQGYYFAHPGTADEITAAIKSGYQV
jgi:diguanylate cyclase (GGDEF)-like protein/PAS domain S-box-containing protein